MSYPAAMARDYHNDRGETNYDRGSLPEYVCMRHVLSSDLKLRLSDFAGYNRCGLCSERPQRSTVLLDLIQEEAAAALYGQYSPADEDERVMFEDGDFVVVGAHIYFSEEVLEDTCPGLFDDELTSALCRGLETNAWTAKPTRGGGV